MLNVIRLFHANILQFKVKYMQKLIFKMSDIQETLFKRVTCPIIFFCPIYQLKTRQGKIIETILQLYIFIQIKILLKLKQSCFIIKQNGDCK